MMNRFYIIFSGLILLSTITFSQNVGVDVASPEQKLDVAGGIKIGTTTNGVAGSLRWNGTTFQFHDGTQWVSLTANTDDQTITDFSVSGQTLSLTLESGNTMTLNLGPTLSAADNQTITDLSIAGNVLSITLENGNTMTLNLTSTLNAADDQTLTLTGDNLSIANGNSVNLATVDNQTITDLSVTGNVLSITIANGNTRTLDLTALLAANDDQTITDLSATGNVLSITLENGNTSTLDLTSMLDANDDQQISLFSLSGTTLSLDIEDNGQVAQTVDLDPLRRQLIDGTANDNDTWVRVAADNGSDNDIIRLATSSTERMRVDNSGNVGIGTGTQALANRLHVEVNSNSAQYPLMIRNAGASNGSGTGAGIAFNNHNANVPKMAIFTERTSDFSFGKMHFLLDPTLDNTPVSLSTDAKMTIQSNGNVGIGTTAPAQKFDLAGTGTISGNLGIGTVSPSESLHVVGGARVSALGAGVVTSDANGVLSSGSLVGTGYGDNLGDHIATLNLTMNDLDILDANTVQANTLLDPEDGTLTVNDNLTITADLTVQGGDIYDNNSHLRLNGEDNVYISMDYNNNDVDDKAIMFGKNDEGGDANWVELMRIAENGNIGIGTTSPGQKLSVEGNLQIGASGYIDDDATMGENSDDWIRLNGYVELKSNTDNYGIVLRDKDNTEYFGITQKDGWSYLTDSNTSSNYFLRGNGANAQVRGSLTVSGLSGGGTQVVSVDNNGLLMAGNDLPGGDDSYIQNQYAAVQTTAEYRISGRGSAGQLGVNNTSSTSGDGISLYGGATSGVPSYGIVFSGTGNLGTHGNVTSDWATYFTMNNTTTRGWVFRRGTTNVASISGSGVATLNEVWADNGSATDPSYTFTSDENTGMYRAGTDQLALTTAGSERLRVISNGNVGVGVTAPLAKLHVQGSTAGDGGWDDDGIMVMNTAGSAGEAAVSFKNSSTGTSYWITGLNQSANYDIAYGTSFTNGNTKMRILTDGNVGIGTVSPTYKLHVSGRLKTTGINETSDARLKKDINPIEGALSLVKQLKGVTYNWKSEEYPEMGLNEDRQYGLIAQEVEKIIPDLVETDKEGWKSIEYTHMVPVLIEAIKEQQKLIVTLQKQNTSLLEETSFLKAQLDKNTGLIELILNNLNEEKTSSSE
ncbi:MAG: tail fiber domain-containing protein [Flavobacteriales bacterium]|nr:tail fiber domain-containing protein [Flavobacteriales bacterium]